MGPCLCGDTACGRCFPSGQVSITCCSCSWTGKVCDLGYVSNEDSDLDDNDGCPKCGFHINVDQDYDAEFSAYQE